MIRFAAPSVTWITAFRSRIRFLLGGGDAGEAGAFAEASSAGVIVEYGQEKGLAVAPSLLRLLTKFRSGRKEEENGDA